MSVPLVALKRWLDRKLRHFSGTWVLLCSFGNQSHLMISSEGILGVFNANGISLSLSLSLSLSQFLKKKTLFMEILGFYFSTERF